MEEEAPIAEIRPNIKKAFTYNILLVGGIVTALIITLVYLNNAVGLDVFVDTFREIGIQFSPISWLSRLIFIIIFFTALLLILNYVALSKTSYVLYPSKMVYNKSFFIVHITDKVIPYINIAKVSSKQKPFLNTSQIILDVTGMKQHKADLDFIDDADEVVEKIHELIKDNRARYYAKYTENYRYQNIMDQA